MEQTVTSILEAATDSVNLINEINGLSSIDGTNMPQAQLNEMVQSNVTHLETVLAYTPIDEQDNMPDVAGSDEDKTSYTTAIATGKSYIVNNS
tara:strand:+ start:822 stop:1100 length:279 start_codon:yes stop_codon:yes gene_type:complete